LKPRLSERELLVGEKIWRLKPLFATVASADSFSRARCHVIEILNSQAAYAEYL